MWLSPPWKTSRISSPCSSVPSASFALTPLFSIDDDAADHLEMTEFLGGDVEQHVLSLRIVFGYGLGEVAHCRRKFALRAAELLQHECRQARIGFRDPHRVHQTLIVNKHRNAPEDDSTKPRQPKYTARSSGLDQT